MISKKALKRIIVLAAAWGAIGSVTHAQTVGASRCQFRTLAELPVRFVRNQPLLETTINGKKALLLADTGAFVSVIFPQGVKYLDLQTSDGGGTVIGGVGGAESVRHTILHEFQLGDYTRKDVPFLVAGGGVGWKVGPKADDVVVGLLGRDFFGQMESEFDLAAGKLRLFTAQGCAGHWLAYWSGSAGVMSMTRTANQTDPFAVPVSLNGRPVDAILDSGAQTSVVTPSAAQRAGVAVIPIPGEQIGQSHGIGGRLVETRMGKFDLVTVGDEQVKMTRLRIGKLFENFEDDLQAGSHVLASHQGPDMLLGADFLRSHRVLISTSQNRLYYSYSGGPVFEVVGPASAPAETSGDVQPKAPPAAQ